MFQRAIVGDGFVGALSELSAPHSFWSASYAELPERCPFEALNLAESRLQPGEWLVGYFGYECAMAVEPQLQLLPPPIDMPAAAFAVFRERSDYELAADNDPPKTDRLDQGASRQDYAEQVLDVQRRIRRGDVFQVNVSHRQSAWFDDQGPSLTDQLPMSNALGARFGAFLDLGDTAIISASPELFLSLEGRHLASEPIKGTRPRCADSTDDALMLQALLADEKDRAENVMIADLMRNDLAKVCQDGSIEEPVLCGARSYPAVHHLYSRIEGELRDGVSFANALRACFPCGSITGAPKLAAMDAIASLEGEGRGAYCGSIFAISSGHAVASVAIRTAIVDKRDGRVDVRSGGGVTVLSDPDAEYEETLDKAYLFRSLTGHHDTDHR
ncbi:MAG: anthranilate synthase component I family protein [Parvularculaceae bacterium]|nr:anthranilate synthase component I family protein [Parvularculaceae bacterium]